MRKFSVNVNGTRYEVEVEEIDAATAAKAAESKPSAPASAPSGAGVEVKAPMPGNILQVNIKPGDTVKEGQQLMILEAMKMENEILAPASGKITIIAVAKGSTVESGSLLCTIA
ncbi:MAG: biotin/lipoyl-binding protein [Clostridia bacterium]|jgi:biotin carboxyl carrier protein|nr:biotin/lipoyl-binding protein [Clostridia bacterium]MBR0437099.1 biotin/lipoyl-binding protein [Clostridia bacterium]MBR3038637.1 biotin/lipoyl-binding protein [Clostridia bacterium]